MKKLLLIALIVGCSTEPEEIVIPGVDEVCENTYSELDGSLVSCGTGCIESGGECYLQNDIDVLADIIELDSLDVLYLQLGSQQWIQGRLVSLDLQYNWNSGIILDTLPTTISNLTALTSLDLRYNNLTDLPNTICDIYDSLSVLLLSQNQICPPYPACITDEDLEYQYQNNCQSMGCMDNTGCNYDESVMYSYLNDACWYPNDGCDCNYPQYTVVDCAGTCDGNNICGCTDDSGCNYDSSASFDDGSCAYPEENYDCDGNCTVVDECGVCDGDGSTCISDYDGNIYSLIQIGEQLWMAENLKVTHYNNGDVISTGYSNSDWTELSTGAYAVYNDDPSNADVYGNLYNAYAVNDDRGLCPEGWHVPSDGEFMELEMLLGMSEEDANGSQWRGTNEGSKLAGQAELWWNGDLENNSEFETSGFNALPAGYRVGWNDDNYSNMGVIGYFWLLNIDGWSLEAPRRGISYYQSTVLRNSHDKRTGFSIRCLGD